MKIYDYLLIIKDVKIFLDLLTKVNTMLNLKEQYALSRPSGSVLEVYRDDRGGIIDTKSIIGSFSLYEESNKAFQWLLDNECQHKAVYESFNEASYALLVQKYPKIEEAKNKFDWGYQAKHWRDYPQTRKVDETCFVECTECLKTFEVCGISYTLEDEKLQCPHCKEVLTIEAAYVTIARGYKKE